MYELRRAPVRAHLICPRCRQSPLLKDIHGDMCCPVCGHVAYDPKQLEAAYHDAKYYRKTEEWELRRSAYHRDVTAPQRLAENIRHARKLWQQRKRAKEKQMRSEQAER